MKRESLETIYQDGDLLLGKYEGQYCLFKGEQPYLLAGHPYEPCLYIKAAQGILITVHNSFTLDELCRAAETNGTISEMISLIRILQPAIAADIEPISYMATAPVFRERVAPVYFRRKRESVLTELPELIETKEWCELSIKERYIYESTVLSKNYPSVRQVSWNVSESLKESCKASGIVFLSNKLDKISKDLGEVSRRIASLENKMDQALNRQKNEIIVEYKSIVKRYYTMAMRVSDKHDIDPLEINELIITISSFIEKMFGNLIDDAFDRELAISMMYSLVNPYASLIREYIIRYFCIYEKIPANYADHLETFNVFLDDDFCNKVKECYFIDKGMSNRTSINTFNAEVMGITNSVTKIKDIKDLLQQLKTKENYLRFSESLDEEVRRCAEEYYGTVVVG